MAATIIDGKAVAEGIRAEVRAGSDRLKASRGITPGLAFILVGEDPASQAYVRMKGKGCEEEGSGGFVGAAKGGGSEGAFDAEDAGAVAGRAVAVGVPGAPGAEVGASCPPEATSSISGGSGSGFNCAPRSKISPGKGSVSASAAARNSRAMTGNPSCSAFLAKARYFRLA